MKVRMVIAVVTLGWVFAAAQSGGDRLAELKRRAEAAPPPEQARLFISIARLQLDDAKAAYDAGKAPQAQADLLELGSAAQRAAQAALQSRKRVKNTEIDLRKLTERLKNLKPTLNVEDRDAVQQAIDRLEKLRTELMTQMFSKPT